MPSILFSIARCLPLHVTQMCEGPETNPPRFDVPELTPEAASLDTHSFR